MMKQLRDTEVIADVSAAVDWLGVQAGVDAARLGIIGFCMGGRVSYMMAAANPRLEAAVVYYGGNIMRPWGDGVPAPFARTSDIGCPILFHFGAEDTNPSPDDTHTLDAELTRCDKYHEFHAIPRCTRPSKGNQWYFGLKVHIGADSQTKQVHSAAVTAANVHDSQVLEDLLHGEETRVWGDSTYAGQREVLAEHAPLAHDYTHVPRWNISSGY